MRARCCARRTSNRRRDHLRSWKGAWHSRRNGSLGRSRHSVSSRWIENHRWWRGNGIHKLRLYILDCYAEEGHPSPRIAPPYAVTFLNERATGIYSVALCGVDHRQDTRRRAMINHWCFKRCAVLGFGQLAKTRQILASALAMALDRRCRKTIFRGTETDRIARRVISPQIRSASMNYNRVDRFNTST